MMKNVFLIIIIQYLFIIINGDAPYNGKECIVKSEFIYRVEDVPFPGCHASTLIETKNGLLAAWFGGTAERNPDVGIWISRFSNGSWTIPLEVANGVQYKSRRYPTWNPVLYNTGKEILLFYKVGPSPSEWWGEMMTSTDNGKTWTRAYRLPEGIYGPIKNKPILLDDGVLICPSSTENDGWIVHMEFTEDSGLTWDRTTGLNDKNIGAIQPTLLHHKDGCLQMLCRSTVSGILTSWSIDNGHSWDTLVSTGLPNPNSGIDAISMTDGRFLLVYNHLKKGRNILNVAISDDGKEWKAVTILENDLVGTEFSYPSVIQAKDGLIHITYTWNRKLIKHVVLDPKKITGRPFLVGEWPEE